MLADYSLNLGVIRLTFVLDPNDGFQGDFPIFWAVEVAIGHLDKS
jgi:hypothetical protein